MEDFFDQYEFRIFGEEYLKFKHFIEAYQFIRIKVSIREGWKNRETGKIGPPRIKFNHFELLRDTIKINSKKLILSSDLNFLDEDQISKIQKILNRYKGNKPISFDVYHPKDKMRIILNSRKQKVDVCPELLDELDTASIKYQIK